ncbi:MAG: C45 family autoproteolytic acyltransferase/hydrolase [Promethearchaeota archaeon]
MFIFTIGIYYVIGFFSIRKIKNYGRIWLKLERNIKYKKLRKACFILLVLFLGSSILLVSYNISNRIAFFKFNISGYSEWVNSNGQKYLYIEADNSYDLGYHTGFQLSSEIIKMKLLIYLYAPILGLCYSEFENLCLNYLSYIPEIYKQEIQGISDGASAGGGFYISFRDIVVQSVFFEVVYGRISPSKLSMNKVLGCTALGSKNMNGSVVIGQNMDLLKPFSWVQSFVLHRLKGKPLIFTYRLGGCPALPMGKNEYGLTIITNLVQTNIEAPVTEPTFVVVREGLTNYKNIEDICKTLVLNNKSAYSRNLIVANRTSILSVQALPENHTIQIPTTTIVQSNTYVNPYWQKYLTDLNYSKDRQALAENLISIAYNNNELTNSELLNILKSQPIICRDEPGLFGTQTVAFMTFNSFGLGKPNRRIGIIPI